MLALILIMWLSVHVKLNDLMAQRLIVLLVEYVYYQSRLTLCFALI